MIKTLLTTCLLSIALSVNAANMITVTAKPIERGATISADDLTTVDISNQPRRVGTLEASAIIGLETRRNIAAGQPLYGQDVQRPLMVKRNQMVTLLLSRSGLAIATSGKALNDGSKGAMVRVQNVSSKQIIEGEVATDGVVRVATLSAPQIPVGF
jgi:flagellar basal body P-ring formation protein FlgA